VNGATKKVGQTLESYTVHTKTWKSDGLTKQRAKSWFGQPQEEGRHHFTVWPQSMADDTIRMVEATVAIDNIDAHLQCYTDNCYVKLNFHLPSSSVSGFLAQLSDMEGALRDFLSVSQIMGPGDEQQYMQQLRKLARNMLDKNLKLPGVD
jgi:hypothetical protein